MHNDGIVPPCVPWRNPRSYAFEDFKDKSGTTKSIVPHSEVYIFSKKYID